MQLAVRLPEHSLSISIRVYFSDCNDLLVTGVNVRQVGLTCTSQVSPGRFTVAMTDDNGCGPSLDATTLVY